MDDEEKKIIDNYPYRTFTKSLCKSAETKVQPIQHRKLKNSIILQSCEIILWDRK